MQPRAVLLVEGLSDRLAVEALARRRGRDLAADGVSVLPIGGAQAMGRFLDRYGPRGSDVVLAGLCDAGEEARLRSFRTYQRQVAHRGRMPEEQLRSFLANWKVRLAAPLVEALDLARTPRPLEAVLARV